MEAQLLQAIDIANGVVQAGQSPTITQEALAYLEQVKANKEQEQIWTTAWNVFTARNDTTRRPLHNQAQRIFCLTLVNSFLEDR
jgi:hypothetical protein